MMTFDDVTAIDAVLGTGGVAGLFMLAKEGLKRFAGKAMETAEFTARTDIIEDLRKEVKALRERVEQLESRVAKLTDRLVTVRGHALVAHSIVLTHCGTCPHRQQLLDTIAEIIKED